MLPTTTTATTTKISNHFFRNFGSVVKISYRFSNINLL